MIPKNIFIVWVTEERRKIEVIPNFVHNSVTAFKKVNPQYNVIFVDDNNEDAIECKKLLNKIKFKAPVGMFCETLRLYMLMKYGGIYVDADCFPVKPFDSQLDQYDCVISKGDQYIIAMPKQKIDSFIDITSYVIGNNVGTFYCPQAPSLICHYNLTNQDEYHKILLKDKFLAGTLQIGEKLDEKTNDEMYYVDHYKINTWNGAYDEYINKRNIAI